ncbi:family 1 extracellular solute-binding protein [[Clostridium] cellulosi]|jgi:Bacterial extracellular solute-binding protein.|uniref:Family 1 extracellular solute-binding protein n=1 Tax=[Clostridium] cellulosi TaxID=29343 RepID=A0A078KR95_9FIRM|nr:family 1 extracellular solute-binding protein [[Clostridium] cellulosi]
MKKKLLAVISAACAAAVLLTSCSGGSKNSSSSNSSGTKFPANTNFTMWSFSALHTSFFKNAETQWNIAHPDTKIKLEITTMNVNDLRNKLLVAISAGTGAPDFANVEAGASFQSVLKGTPQLVDLSDLIANEKDKFLKAKLDAYSKDGKLYGIDFQGGATLTFYNTEIFKQAGLDPTTIKTWDDFIAAGKTIKEKTGKLMFYTSQNIDREYQLLVGQMGSDYFDKDGKCILDNETNVKALKMLHDMIYVDKIAAPAPGGSNDTEQAYGAIDKGNVAAVIMPDYYLNRFTNYMPDLKGKILISAPPAFPDAKYKTVVAGGTGTCITKQCQNIELAKKFLYESKVTEQACNNIWTILGNDPPRTDVWDTISESIDPNNKYVQYFVNGKDLFKVLSSFKDSVGVITNNQYTPILIDNLTNSAFYRVLVNNSQDPEAALKSVADEVRKEM